jgi:hypothetical protein
MLVRRKTIAHAISAGHYDVVAFLGSVGGE